MKIKELFAIIEENLPNEDINGEFQLKGNCIVWTFNLNDNSEEITVLNEDDEDESFSFESTSNEEILQDAYDEDLEALEALLDEQEETDNWTFSEIEASETIISFRIFKKS